MELSLKGRHIERRHLAAAGVLLALTLLWLSAAPSLAGGGTFHLTDFFGSHVLGMTVLAAAQSIVSYLNSWWGAAIGIAILASIGLGWAAGVIEALIAEFGISDAVAYATSL
jgi:hypothetical protein